MYLQIVMSCFTQCNKSLFKLLLKVNVTSYNKNINFINVVLHRVHPV